MTMDEENSPKIRVDRYTDRFQETARRSVSKSQVSDDITLLWAEISIIDACLQDSLEVPLLTQDFIAVCFGLKTPINTDEESLTALSKAKRIEAENNLQDNKTAFWSAWWDYNNAKTVAQQYSIPFDKGFPTELGLVSRHGCDGCMTTSDNVPCTLYPTRDGDTWESCVRCDRVDQSCSKAGEHVEAMLK